MRLKINTIPTFISLIIVCVGCKKFVEIPPPSTELVTASVFNTNATATAAQLNIYTQMANNGESCNMAQFTGLQSDELTNYSTSQLYISYYTNELTALESPGPWTDAYNYIYQANAIIAALNNNSNISSSVQQQLTGESLFVRAFWYFYLTNLYGNVPLVTSINYSINATISRSSQAKIYQQIITDLQSAQALLSSNYVDATDTTVTSARIRPTKWAATALLARVYLYTGEYPDAATQATAVIGNSGLYSLDANLNNVFLANSSEAIWQLAIPLPSSTDATIDGASFILLSAPSINTNNSSTISPELLASFDAGDNRKTDWISYYSAGTDTFYFPYKYKVYQASSVTEYVMVLRLAEQYLIRAEAEAEQNDLADAVKDLNVIRNRAGLTDTVAGTQTQVLASILHERQVEFFTEWGNRWFDLIRTGNANTVMGIVTPSKGGNWSASDSLYPIPQSEISIDPNLTQNPGY